MYRLYSIDKWEQIGCCLCRALVDLWGLTGGPENPHQARALLAEHCGKITLVRFSDNGRWSCVAKGKVDLWDQALGVRGSCQGCQI